MSSDSKILHGPHLNIPNVSLGRFLWDNLKNHGEKACLIDAISGKSVTFSHILEQSIKMAKWLKTRGIQSGDVIAISCGNNPEFCFAILSAIFLGATVATLNPNYNIRELQHALGICKPKIIFCSPSSENNIAVAVRGLTQIQDVVVLAETSSRGHIPLPVLLQQDSRQFVPVNVDPENNIAAILYSSGTTGLSKGVMLTDKNIITSLLQNGDQRCVGHMPNSILLGVLPFFHGYAFILVLSSFAIGFTMVVMQKFEEELFLKTIENFKVTTLPLVPPLMVFLAKHPTVDNYNLKSVKEIISGAAYMSKEIQDQVKDRIKAENIRQGYGLTESTQVLTIVPRGVHNKYGSVGRLVVGVAAKVLDTQTGEILGAYEKGELCFKGPCVMKGYCGDVAATKQTIDSDGWLHSGDVGYYDEDGYFYIVDRVKELIKYKGFQVPPVELESILLSHPGIKDAAVIGIPDEDAGELPMAFVVKQDTATVTANDIQEFVSGQVSSYKRLRGGVRFIDEIPKTASGKIVRRELLALVKSKL